MTPTEADPAAKHILGPLLPKDVPPEAFFSAEALEALEAHRRHLEALGFQLEVHERHLRVRHEVRHFEFVTRFSDRDDLSERRRLFSALKEAFGTFWDRFSRIGWNPQPSAVVSVPYDHLKAILSLCQAAQLRLRRLK